MADTYMSNAHEPTNGSSASQMKSHAMGRADDVADLHHADLYKNEDEKMYTFLRGVATGGQMCETLKALPYARALHVKQKRKSGEPYIIHPEKMACEAVSLGLGYDTLLAVCLLHDCVEDCGIKVDDLPVSDAVKRGVRLMTFEVLEGETKETAKARYFDAMIQSREATLCKIIDRTHNVSTMSGVFSEQKLVAYIAETRTYVLPLIKRAKEVYPQDANVMFALKFHISAVIDSIENMMKQGR